MGASAFLGKVVASIDVAEDPHHWVVGEYPLKTHGGFIGAVGNNHHACVLAETNAHTATVMAKRSKTTMIALLALRGR